MLTGNVMTWVDTGDPASFPYNVQPVLAAGFMWAHNVYAVPGFQQVLVGGPFWGGLDLWDITAPLSPFVEYAGFGSYYMGFTSTGGWISPRHYGDIGMYLNKLDYNPPIFSGGLANDGWIAPTGAPATLPAATTLKVHVEDDVAVTRVLFLCYYNDPCAQDPNYFDDGGAIVLGYGALNDADGLWTLDVNAADIPGTDYMFFLAIAYDAGNNASASGFNGPWHTHNGGPIVTVSVAPTGTEDAPYIWSTVTVSAKVVNPPTAAVWRVLFKVDGVSIGNGVYNPSTNLWYVSLNTTTYTDGNHVFTAEATDLFGGVGISDPVTKFIANSGPNSVLLTAPLSGSQVYGTAVPVSATVGDWPVPIDHVTFYLDRPANATTGGTVIGTATTGGEGGTYSIVWDTTGVADGNHTIVAVATDKRWDGTMRNGNSTWISFSKITPAPLTATIMTSPAVVTDATPVTAIATVGGGIAPYHYAWTVDGTAFGTDSASATTGLLTVGAHTIALTVTDSATPASTKDASASINVIASIVPPIVTGVTKVSDASGFRLKVYGTNFHAGCTVMINGAAVPTTVFKSSAQVNAKGWRPQGHGAQGRDRSDYRQEQR